MIRFYNTKMMSPDELVSDPVTPGKGTYAYDKVIIDNIPEDLETFSVDQLTENFLTYLESDHPVETEEPDAEKQIIYNHDYILEVTPSKDALVRESKELLDAEIRAGVAQSVEPPVEPTTDPVTPVPGQQS